MDEPLTLPCQQCAEPLRQDKDGDWMDAETHLTGLDGHRHEPVRLPPLPEATPRCLAEPWCGRPAGHRGRCIGRVEQATNDGSIGTGKERNSHAGLGDLAEEMERQKRDGVGVFNPRFAEDDCREAQDNTPSLGPFKT